MALKIEIQNVSSYESTTSTAESKSNISLTTDKKTASVFLKYDEKNIQEYVLSVLMMTFRKRMYHPTEIVLELQIMPVQGETSVEEWHDISKDTITTLLKNKQVTIYDQTGITTEGDKLIIPDQNYLGKDFYVKDVVPTYMGSSMRVKLNIYSPDYQLTQQHTSRTFVSKKLSAILEAELTKEKVKLPYNSDETISYSTSGMKVLPYKSTEHIFPYLVQYNESFYDMLARTTNRWGEFMFYEDGKLNIGYKAVEKGKEKKIVETTTSNNVTKVKAKFNHLTYINYEDGASIGNNYDLAAGYDKNILESTVKKDPNSVKGFLFKPGGKIDKPIMKGISSFFKNDKTLPIFATNLVFDDLYGIGMKTISVNHDNKEFNSKFFTSAMEKKTPEHYNSGKNEYNLFTEQGSEFKADKYGKIVAKEQAASKDAVSIYYDTRFPGLKLGDIITYGGKTYIVVHIEGRPKDLSWVSDDLWVKSTKDDPTVYYQVIATPVDADTNFYPTMIAQGHVRYADSQFAKVADEEDPKGEGRVRVLFPWQDKADTASPWLQFVGNAGGKTGIIGAHYKDDVVSVSFIDGNVERPYVTGCLQEGAETDIQCTSPGGHTLTIGDNPNGISDFILGTMTPIVGTVKDFIPGWNTNFAEGWKKNLYFAGGFELKDQYGIYKISGSTEGRNISIASPWGDVKINAFTGISISAPNGDVKISGKNVTIEAGNNLKLLSGKNVEKSLWHTGNQETTLGSFAQIALDMTTAVTKKLAETFTTVVDLSIIRSIAEIMFRPVEGSLTVKSNRFLKLEAGNNKAKIPAAAYNQEKKIKLLNAENKKDILSAVGSGTFLTKLTNLSLDNGMVELISTIKPASESLVSTFKSRMEACIEAKKVFDKYFAKLKYYSDDDQAACKTYEELKDEFWKAEPYKKWGEDKLEFKDNVKILADADQDDYQKLKGAVKAKAVWRINGLADNQKITKTRGKEYRQIIILKRINNREKTLNAANALRKAICNVMSVQELKRKDVLKYFSVYWQTMPDDFKSSLVSALSKDACKASPVFTPTDKMKNLASANLNEVVDIEKVKKHLRRLAAYNMLSNLGFDEASRKKVGDPLASVPEPNVADMDDAGDTSLLNTTYWRKYVASLSGVPPISKDSKTFGAQIRDSFTGAINDQLESVMELNPVKMYDEITSWGEGKEGRILFATDKTTYQMEKNAFTKVQGIKPTLTSLKEDDASLDGGQQQKIKDFVGAVRAALIKDNF